MGYNAHSSGVKSRYYIDAVMKLKNIIMTVGMLALLPGGGYGVAVASGAQVVPVKIIRIPRQVASPVVRSLIPPSEHRKRIPDHFFRHDRAREAVKSGKIVSLSVIRNKIRKNYPGKIVDVRLFEPKGKKGQHMYNVRVLTKQGKVLVITVNAKSAKVVKVRG